MTFNSIKFMGLFVLEILAEFIGAIVVYAIDKSENKVSSGGLFPMFVHFAVVCVKVFVNYTIYKNWIKLPTDGLTAFDKFRTENVDNTDFLV